MNKTLLVACAVAGGLFAALAAPPPAQALPSVNLGIDAKADAVTPVARRFRRSRRVHHGYDPDVENGYYRRRCAWLRWKFYNTSDLYWWDHYNRCQKYYC